MSVKEIITTLKNLRLDIEPIEDGDVKQSVMVLLNLVETLSAETERLEEENQKLKDEIARLKGEQGKPKISGKKRKSEDISSEKERQNESGVRGKKEPRKRDSKRDQIPIDRKQVCPVDRDRLPEDAVFKGYESVVVQELKITTDHVEYQREVFYSASQKKTYRGPLPEGVEGEFGPGIRSLIVVMKHVCAMSEPKILEFLHNFQVQISPAYISSVLTKKVELFHAEKDELYRAGLQCGDYQQIDDTSARGNGENHYTQILCNPLYTAYFTTARKDRLTVLDVLRNFAPRRFIFNAETRQLLEAFKVSNKLIKRLDALEQDRFLNEEQIQEQVEPLALGKKQHSRVLEAAAIAAYHQETEIPVVKWLLCDDAPQFKRLTEELALCWVHDAQHYKRLHPVVPIHQQQLEAFRKDYWAFYRKLLQFKESPAPAQAERLSKEFDQLFSTRTGYDSLDDRIAKSQEKKESLLAVLRHPELPLHNNAAELAARVQARARDVSLHTKSKAGTKAKDTFMSILQTAKKLGVNTYQYLYDRVSGKFELPSLAQLIREKSKAEPPACPKPP